MPPARKCRGAPPAAAPVRRAAAGHRLPAPLPAGLTLTDVSQQRWRLGRSIGCGGFGEIYAAARDSAAEAAHAVKVEPHSSGPLFSEMHCYHRVARAETIAAWQRARRLRRLGMPRFVGSGSVEHAGERYRFMVMDRFGTDLQQVLDRHGGRFPFSAALNIGIQVLDTLEYIHSREYIHADIKAQNLLLGYKRGTENQVYLVDFGLACRYALDGRHKPYRPDLRKAHAGTIEFTSRDAHIGAHSRRGDLEILGYNLLQWTAGALPWQQLVHDPDLVAAEKSRHMSHMPGLVRACYGDTPPPEAEVLQQYLQMVAALAFDAPPDYDALRDVLRAGLGHSSAVGCARLEFSTKTGVSPAPSFWYCSSSAEVLSAGAASPAGPRLTAVPAARRPRSRSRSGRRHQPAAKRCRTAPASRASSGSGQENSLGRPHRRPGRPPGRRGRPPLRLVTDNSVTPLPPPPPPPEEPPVMPPITSPSLRSDGKLRDFDWQHFNKVVELARRRAAVQRPAVPDDGSGDTGSPEEPTHTVYDNMTPAMRDVLAKRQQRSPEKGDHRGRKRSRTVSHSSPESIGTGSPVTPAMAAVMLIRARRLAAAAEVAAAASRLAKTAGGLAKTAGGRQRRAGLQLCSPEPRKPTLRAGLLCSPEPRKPTRAGPLCSPEPRPTLRASRRLRALQGSPQAV